MDIVRAFTFPFEDRAWVEKLLITLVISAITIILSPLFVGLLGWAALLGYQVDLVRNWRQERPNPLPAWNNFSRLLSQGFYPLVAILLYTVPNLIISGTIMIFGQNLGAGWVGSTLTLFFSCCMFPILLLYNLISLPMFALALGRFVDEPRLGVFFEIGHLLVTLRDHLSTTIMFLVGLLIVGFVFGFLGTLTLGLLPLALGAPVLGALTGQLALVMLGKPKRSEGDRHEPAKPKRR
ncbi:MAG: DUF4013 domain-containing protein [Chloroflexi bacterium]|nr:DUF4013 domain-containing protein [Chloroflexota bacterium]